MSSTNPNKKKKQKLRWQVKLILAIAGVIVFASVLGSLTSLFASGKKEEATAQTNQTGEEVVEEVKEALNPVMTEVKKPTVPFDKRVTVLIDPGHGGFDPGNVVEEQKESAINLAIATACAEQLKSLDPNLNVLMTRNSDTISWASDEVGDLTGRVNMQTDLKADYFVSIHSNSNEDPSCTGYSFFIKKDDDTAKEMAQSISEAYEQADWAYEQAVLTTDTYPLQVISDSKIPSILIEMGYMSNPGEFAALCNPEIQEILGKVTANGIYNFLVEQNEKGAAIQKDS